MDLLHQFVFSNTPIRGRIVQLTRSYVEAVQYQDLTVEGLNLLGEALAAVSLVADSLKFDGSVTLQAQGQGKISKLVAECHGGHFIRGLAINNEKVKSSEGESVGISLISGNQLAISLLPKSDKQMQPYQGIVELKKEGLAQSLSLYFKSSEQLLTSFVLKCLNGKSAGLFLQKLPTNEDTSSLNDDFDDTWNTLNILAGTVTHDELTSLPAPEVVRRLFHEHQHRIFEPKEIKFGCRCSSEKSQDAIILVGYKEAIQIIEEEGTLSVDCSYCNKRYEYDREQITKIFARKADISH